MAAGAETQKLVFNDNADGFKTFSFGALSKLPIFLRKRRRALGLDTDTASTVTTTPPVVQIQPAEVAPNEQNSAWPAADHQKANSFFASAASAQKISSPETNHGGQSDQFDVSSSPRDRTNSKTFTQTWHSALGRLKSQVDPWSDFQRYPVERCTRYRYHASTGEWTDDIVLVQIEPTPFGHGAMRQCHRLKLIRYTNDERKLGTRTFYSAQNFVAKRYMDAVEAVMYFDDVRMQMTAKMYAELYSRMEMAPKKVDVMQMWVVEFTERSNTPLFHLEPFIEGTYEKYNSNSGFLSRMARCTPQTFSHYTFEVSNKQLVVCDIQGVGDLYTDPQIHTAAGTDYGDGNLGVKGMALFFHTHRCNELCRALDLKPFPLSEKELLVQKQHETASSRQPSRRASFSEVDAASAAAKAHEAASREVVYTLRMSSLSQSAETQQIEGGPGVVSSVNDTQVGFDVVVPTRPRKKSTKSESSDASFATGLGQPCIGGISTPQTRKRLPANFTRTMSLLVGGNPHNDEKSRGSKTRSGTESRRDRRFNVSTISISEDAVLAMSDDDDEQESFKQRHDEEGDDSVYDDYADSGITGSDGKQGSSDRLRHNTRNSESSMGESSEEKRDIVGQIHLEMVKYHELGRFAHMDNSNEDGEPYEAKPIVDTYLETADMRGFNCDVNSANYDRDSALFHLHVAAEHGQREALHAMADICLDMPHDLLGDVTIENALKLQLSSAPSQWRDDPVSLGYDQLLRCAESGDRDCMARVARALHNGVSEAKSECWNVPQWKAAVSWYERAATQQQSSDACSPAAATGGAVLDSPNWILLASAAQLLLKGGNGLDKDPQRAGDLYAQAAELAADGMQGKLSTKYYCLSEEAYGHVEEE